MFSRSPTVVDDPYREWASFYPPTAHNALMRVEERAMVSLLPDVAGKWVVDAGSGTGRYAQLVRERGAARVMCVDRSLAMLRSATTRSRRIRADFAALPLASGAFDLVVAGLALMDVADLAGALADWSRVLRPHGVALCSTLHPRGETAGWTRTFETPSGTGRLPVHWHALADFRSACADAALEIDAIEEPSLDTTPREPVALIVRAHRRH